ncbi:hypothetical protein Rs2_50366 [Raphanus sativus]|uniref:FBD-associated F-box protein At5g56560 n=1 Tax=Raphanus sativus TaxID=3726 RepID=A0A9W3CX93_RAPSA|nr:putative FBD-associated F-box protein At5g56560 [Raphanus sativus]KAJ4868086.1 hypothetical protein Rs2_50366 [Raphanus sativus]
MEEPSLSELPDDLILKIFSLLPFFKESVATNLLEKRCEDLMFDDDDKSHESLVKFTSFAYGSLSFNKSQIVDIKLSRNYSASDISFLLKLAVKRSVRRLRIRTFGKTLELPRCLSICVTLKSLVLYEVRIKVVPPCFRLPSLKNLHLLSVKFSVHESLERFLKSCHDIEHLVIHNVLFKTVLPCRLLPSLKSMRLISTNFWENESAASLLRICPVLKDLVVDQTKVFSSNVCASITCSALKTLILGGLTINAVPPSFSMPSLKAMQLLSVKFSGGESVLSLLQKCPVLEDLVVNQTQVFDSNECTMSSCRTLKKLTLSELSIKAVPPWFRLPSLKTLHLLSVKFSGEESIASFLPVCPVLECLVVDRTKDDSVMFEDVPVWFCLPSLKSLHLLSVKFSDEESFSKLIERCPVLEDLVINNTLDDNVMIFNIDTPSLRSLSIVNSIRKNPHVMEKHGFVINAPSLEKINFKDTFSNLLVFEHMPAVTEANIQVICGQSKKFIGSFTSIRQLSVCSLSSETPYPSGTIFPYLEHLELCTCSAGWANLLVCILKDAPTLRYLKLKSQHGADYNDPMNYWNKPTAVPECLSTHLEIMEWRQYEGTEEVMNVAAYILANARCLKTATFSTRCGDKHHSMLRELRSLKRGSDTCQLLFD